MKCELLTEQNLMLLLDFVDDENTKYDEAVLKSFINEKNAYEALRGLESVDVHERVGYLPRCHPFRIHRDDFLVDLRDIFLAFFYYLRLEGRLPILGHFDLHASVARRDPLALIPVPGIVAVGTLGLLIPKVLIHLCFHHFLDGSA